MAINYEFLFNNPDFDELEEYLKGMPYFEKYDIETTSYIYRKETSKYPDAVIVLHDIGIDFTDYLTGVGRELIGLLIEYLTGLYEEILVKEKKINNNKIATYNKSINADPKHVRSLVLSQFRVYLLWPNTGLLGAGYRKR